MTWRVIFCPITIIISQALRNNAFHAPSLTCAARVFQIKNVRPIKCTPIRWKESMLIIPLFHRFDGVLSRNLPLQYHKLRDDIARRSLDAGKETAIGPKTLRRMAANAINGRLEPGRARKSDLILTLTGESAYRQRTRHRPRPGDAPQAKSSTTSKTLSWTSRTEDGLIQFWSHMSLMSDPRASSDMVPDEVWQEMLPDLEIEDGEHRRAGLKGGQFRIQGHNNETETRDLTRQIRIKERQRKKNIKTGYRKYYFQNRPTWDMERQFGGEAEEEEAEVEYVAPAIELHIPERAELAEMLVN
ncbi:hypothetical protein IL306_009273 [Fusarium sp. DS 682]|nr:hypothetical protein IL306_009273 [Fusarium sp. DS 682]